MIRASSVLNQPEIAQDRVGDREPSGGSSFFSMSMLVAKKYTSYCVHNGDIRIQEGHGLDLSDKTRAFKPFIELGLMERGDLGAAFRVRAIESNEVGERGDKKFACPYSSRPSFATFAIGARLQIHRALLSRFL